jgi:hypothetical protein
VALSCGLPHAPRAMANAGARAGHTPPAPGDGGAGQEPGARGARRGRGPRGVAGCGFTHRRGKKRATHDTRDSRHTSTRAHEHNMQQRTKVKRHPRKTPCSRTSEARAQIKYRDLGSKLEALGRCVQAALPLFLSPLPPPPPASSFCAPLRMSVAQ